MRIPAFLMPAALLLFLRSFSQNTIGIPEISSYNKQKYGAGTQNWDIRQDSKGLMHFANNEGLLSFDGTYWKLYPLPNKTIVRSLEIGPDDKIFVGGQDEIGCFAADRTGKLEYTSLKSLMPQKSRSFADVWDTYAFGGDIFFRTKDEIFQFSRNNMIVHTAASEWLFMGRADSLLIAQDAREGLKYFKNGSWLPLINVPSQGMVATSVITYNKDTCLLTTVKNGTWLVTPHSFRPFKLTGGVVVANENFSGVARINGELFALGTTTGGCFIVEKSGKIIQRFAKGSGLSNSSVIAVYRDKNRNLWLGHDSGVDFIAFDNAVRHINPASLNNGAGYGSAVFKDKLYLALSNGVFVMDLPAAKDISTAIASFVPVANSWGQAWGLSVVDDHLFLGSHEGFFEIKDRIATRVRGETGYWMYSGYPDATRSDEEMIIAGNYNGINLYTYKNGNYEFRSRVNGYEESSRFLVVDKDNAIWTSHPYRGVYRILASANGSLTAKLYTAEHGLPSSMSNHVYKVKNRIVVATEKGVYEFNRVRGAFEPSEYFQPIFGQTSVRYLKEDQNGNIWFIHEKDLGIVDFSTLTPSIIYMPELKGKMVSGFEHINPVNDNNVLVGAQEGFYHIDYEKYRRKNFPVVVDIRTVASLGPYDSVLFAGYFSPEQRSPEIDHKWNSFHIEYSSPLFEQQASIEYSYYLEGFDKGWSEWSKKTEKDYTNLPAGKYSFLVKARNNLGNESKPASYTFTVLPPWYQTYWAYAAYVLMALYFCYYLYKRFQKKLRQQHQEYLEKQKQLQYLHQLELEKSEKEIVKLKNEKLQAQIEHKNSELASTAMHLVQKGEILTKIKDELLKLNKQPGNKEIAGNIKKIVKVLNEDDKMNDDWEHFATHFNNVHSDFLISLKERYSNLNAHDLKLCAYLRLNLTSKEIAQLMNISIRGVEISRYRLRKKLQIPTEVNLFNFMLDFHSAIGTMHKNYLDDIN